MGTSGDVKLKIQQKSVFCQKHEKTAFLEENDNFLWRMNFKTTDISNVLWLKKQENNVYHAKMYVLTYPGPPMIIIYKFEKI